MTAQTHTEERPYALVTGGGGFLGRAIVERLLARGRRVRSLARGDYPELTQLGVDVVRGDVGDATAVLEAARGCNIVFHVAAKAGAAGPRASYVRTNITGTENVLAACRELGIRKLVYTSTPSVIHTGGDVAGVSESAPYATKFEAAYPETKAVAERMVLAANGANLATVALRPHLLWGPGDTQLVPRIIERAKTGTLRLVGDGRNLIDSTYVDNAADAHLLAGDRVEPGAACAGRAYFLSQGEPLPAAELINRILAAAGLPPVTKSVSPRVAYAVGWLLEGVHALFKSDREPRMTRFIARQLSTSHWYDIGAARRELGYVPTVTIDEGMARLAVWLRGRASSC